MAQDHVRRVPVRDLRSGAENFGVVHGRFFALFAAFGLDARADRAHIRPEPQIVRVLAT
jgi:hypothetical protein